MGTFLHRTSKQLFESVAPDALAGSIGDYISEPDVSPVSGVPSKYWIITGDVVSEMIQSEKDAVDVAFLVASRDSIIEEVDNFEGIMRQVIKLIISELNILRSEHGLPNRTLNQLKAQIRNGLGD